MAVTCLMDGLNSANELFEVVPADTVSKKPCFGHIVEELSTLDEL